MSARPIHTVHLLYDSEAVDENLFRENLRVMLEELSTSSPTSADIRLSVMCMGRHIRMTEESKRVETYISLAEHGHVDLKGAFNQVISEYRAMDREMLGMKNPEILIFLGSKPGNDWLSVWQKIEPYRALLLTYWVTRQPLNDYEKRDIERLLGQISLPDPTTGAPRFKIVHVSDNDQISFLQDVFSKLKGRIKERVIG